MDGEDGNRARSSYASNHSCTFSFIVISSGPVLVSTAAFSLSSSYKENAPSSTSSSDTV